MSSEFFKSLSPSQKDMILQNAMEIVNKQILAKGPFANMIKEFDRYHKMYIGEHFETGVSTQDTPERVVVNHCFKDVETLYSVLKDIRLTARVYPRYDFMPVYTKVPETDEKGNPVLDEKGNPKMKVSNWEDPERFIDVQERADMLTKILDAVTRESGLMDVIDDITHDSCEYGIGLGKPYFDPEARFGDGLIRACRVPIKNGIPADIGIKEMTDQPFFITVTAMPWSKILRLYDLNEEQERELLGKNTRNNAVNSQTEDPTEYIKTTSSADKQNKLEFFGDSDLIPVTQVYIKHREVFKQYSDNKYEKSLKKMATELDRVTVTFCDNVLLDVDKFYEHGEIPVVPMRDYDYPGKFYGIGEVAVASPINHQINYMWSLILANIKTMGSGKIIIEEDAELDAITTAPGDIVRVKKGTLAAGKIKFVPGTPVNPNMFQFIDKKERELEAVSGITNSSASGRPPGQGVEAAKAIKQLAEAASQRMRPKILNKAKFIKDFYSQILFLVLEYYEDRIFRIVGADKVQNFIHFKKEAEENHGWYDIEIEGAEQLPLGRGEFASLLMQLMNTPLEQEGKVTEKVVYQALGLPRGDDLAADTEKRKQKAYEQKKAMAEAQATAGARMAAENNSALLGSDNPTQTQKGLTNIGIGG